MPGGKTQLSQPGRLSRLALLVRQRNGVALLQLSHKLLPRWLFRFERIVITRGDRIPECPMPRDILFERLQADDPLPGAALAALEDPDPVALGRRCRDDLARGRDGYVARRDGAIVAYAWAARQRHHVPEVGFELLLQPDEACTYRSYVAPSYRFTRVYAALARFALDDLRRRGARWFIGYGQSANLHSIQTHKRMGYEIVGWIALVEFLAVSLQVRRLRSEAGRMRWRLALRKRGRTVYGTAPVAVSGAAPAASEAAVMASPVA
jgi:GNAT superfamily N-acetyltransferase